VTTILLNAVFNPALEIVHRSGHQLLIDREHFLADGILQLVQITGFVNVHTALQMACIDLQFCKNKSISI
jgi:hypothetical protein